MAAQTTGIARIHIGRGTELVPDIAKSPEEPTYTSTFTPGFRAVNVRGLENFLKPHQINPTL